MDEPLAHPLHAVARGLLLSLTPTDVTVPNLIAVIGQAGQSELVYWGWEGTCLQQRSAPWLPHACRSLDFSVGCANENKAAVGSLADDYRERPRIAFSYIRVNCHLWWLNSTGICRPGVQIGGVLPDVNSEVHEKGDRHERAAEPPTCQVALQILHSVGAKMSEARVV
jgi:hypothetical protein